MAPEQISKLVQGWFVAQIMNLRKQESQAAKGPKISVWAKEDAKYVEFPHPLLGLKSESIVSNPDLLPGVLESIGLAMAHCDQVSNLSPLQAYWEMIKIGESFQDILENWIRRAQIFDQAPLPDSLVAGSSQGTFDERKNAILSALTKTQAFLESMVKGDERKDPWEVSRTTEIRSLWEPAISEISTFVSSMVDEAGSLV
jgi:hypothetical protein